MSIRDRAKFFENANNASPSNSNNKPHPPQSSNNSSFLDRVKLFNSPSNNPPSPSNFNNKPQKSSPQYQSNSNNQPQTPPPNTSPNSSVRDRAKLYQSPTNNNSSPPSNSNNQDQTPPPPSTSTSPSFRDRIKLFQSPTNNSPLPSKPIAINHNPNSNFSKIKDQFNQGIEQQQQQKIRDSEIDLQHSLSAFTYQVNNFIEKIKQIEDSYIQGFNYNSNIISLLADVNEKFKEFNNMKETTQKKIAPAKISSEIEVNFEASHSNLLQSIIHFYQNFDQVQQSKMKEKEDYLQNINSTINLFEASQGSDKIKSFRQQSHPYTVSRYINEIEQLQRDNSFEYRYFEQLKTCSKLEQKLPDDYSKIKEQFNSRKQQLDNLKIQYDNLQFKLSNILNIINTKIQTNLNKISELKKQYQSVQQQLRRANYNDIEEIKSLLTLINQKQEELNQLKQSAKSEFDQNEPDEILNAIKSVEAENSFLFSDITSYSLSHYQSINSLFQREINNIQNAFRYNNTKSNSRYLTEIEQYRNQYSSERSNFELLKQCFKQYSNSEEANSQIENFGNQFKNTSNNLNGLIIQYHQIRLNEAKLSHEIDANFEDSHSNLLQSIIHFYQNFDQVQQSKMKEKEDYLQNINSTINLFEASQGSDKIKSFRQQSHPYTVSRYINEIEQLQRDNSFEYRYFEQLKTCSELEQKLPDDYSKIKEQFNSRKQQLDNLKIQYDNLQFKLSNILNIINTKIQTNLNKISELKKQYQSVQQQLRRANYNDIEEIKSLLTLINQKQEELNQLKQSAKSEFDQNEPDEILNAIKSVEAENSALFSCITSYSLSHYQSINSLFQREINNIQNVLRYNNTRSNSRYSIEIEQYRNQYSSERSNFELLKQCFKQYLNSEEANSQIENFGNQFKNTFNNLNGLIIQYHQACLNEAKEHLAQNLLQVKQYTALIQEKINAIDRAIAEKNQEDPSYFLNQLESDLNRIKLDSILQTIDQLSNEIQALQAKLNSEINTTNTTTNNTDSSNNNQPLEANSEIIDQTFSNLISEFNQKKSDYLSSRYLNSSNEIIKAKRSESRKFIQVQVNPHDMTVRNFQVRNITIGELGSLVQVDLGIPNNNKLTASIDGTKIEDNKLVFDVLGSSNKIIQFTAQNSNTTSKITIVKPLIPNVTSHEFVIFSPFSIEEISRGSIIQIPEISTTQQAMEIITKYFREHYQSAFQQDFQGDLFLPSGIPFNQGTIQAFYDHCPNSKRYLYYVPYSQSLEPLKEKEFKNINILNPETSHLLSPLFTSSQQGLELFACFLVFVQKNGPLTSQLLYAFSKFFSFPPLINSLYALSSNEIINGSSLLQISVTLQSILSLIYKDSSKAFENILDFLPYTLYCVSDVNELHWNSASIDDQKIFNNNQTALDYFQKFPKNKPDYFYTSDLNYTDDVHFQFQIDPNLIELSKQYYNEFSKIPSLAARKSHSIGFMDYNNSPVLRLETVTGNSEIVDRLIIYNPNNGMIETKTTETIVSTQTNEDQLISVGDVSELICIAVDCSGSMGSSFGTGSYFSKIDAAKMCFKDLTTKAFNDFKVDNYYGLVQFGYNDGGNDYSVLSPLHLITQDFNSKLDSITAYGGTPLWEAVDLCIEQLVQKKRELNADIPLRIICLTDGEAYSSSCQQIAYKLVQNKIRFDGIYLDSAGARIPKDFHTMIRLTGSYLLSPQTQEEIHSIFQDEAYFNSFIREYNPFQDPSLYQTISSQMNNDPCDKYIRVSISQSGWLQKPLFTLQTAISRLQDSTDGSLIHNIRVKNRLEMELNTFLQQNDPTIQIFVEQNNFCEWRIPVQLGSIYQNKWFLLIMRFLETNPPLPYFSFYGAPYHVNVSNRGRIYPEIRYDLNNERFYDIIKKVQNLFIKDYNSLLASHPTPVDEEHKNTFQNQQQYEQQIEMSIQKNGKDSPNDFGFTFNQI